MSHVSDMALPPAFGGLSHGAPDVVREQAFIDGRWCTADTGSVLDVVDPATQTSIGSVPNMGGTETRRAIEAAERGQAEWMRWTAFEHGTCLRSWADLMVSQKESLARLMTLEQGKPLAEARGEIDYAASFLSWFASEGERHDGEIITSHLAGRKMFALRMPIGVTAAITPWNFPSAMITRKAGAALAAGCAMIVRPASETPYSALALAALSEESGIPAGVFSVITGEPRPIVETLMADPRVRHLSFTGSTEVGRLLLAQSAATLKKVAMELGGHAPPIVCEDADLDAAVIGALHAKFQTSGQDCLAANCLLVAAPIYDMFCTRYANVIRGLRVGNGFAANVDIGPLINQEAVETCQRHVDDAVRKGACLLVGGHSGVSGPHFYDPTLLANITPAMRIFREETFGPVAGVMPFSSDDQAVSLANDSEFGLAAYVFGRDLVACGDSESACSTA